MYTKGCPPHYYISCFTLCNVKKLTTKGMHFKDNGRGKGIKERIGMQIELNK